MNDTRQNHPGQGAHGDSIQKEHHPYWKRAHHDWRFWVAVVLMLTAISIYVLSLDLSLQPRNRLPAPASGSREK